MSPNELKYVSKLLQKKYRIELNQFLVEGEKVVAEAINSDAFIDSLFIDIKSQQKFTVIINEAKKKNIQVDFIKENELHKICDSKTPQGIAALVNKISNKLKKSDLIVAIESIQDPGNVGTIIRTCDWFGINQIILSEDSVELYNPKLIRSTMGSIFHLNIFESKSFYDDLVSLNRDGYKLLCADLDGEDFKEKEIPRKFVLILSNESKGPSLKLLELNPEKITIKKFGNAESLNVANAAAILLSEFRYRRK